MKRKDQLFACLYLSRLPPLSESLEQATAVVACYCRRGRGCVLVLGNSDERHSSLLFQVDKKTQWSADKQIFALYENCESRKLK